jgi:hypothetical protein
LAFTYVLKDYIEGIGDKLSNFRNSQVHLLDFR